MCTASAVVSSLGRRAVWISTVSEGSRSLRHMAGGRRTPSDGIVLAQLGGRAGFCVSSHGPIEDAVEQLLEITGGRVDLLHQAAGVALGSWEVDPVSYPPRGMQKVNLMLAAGADPEQMKPHRLEVVARLSQPHPTQASRAKGPGTVQGRAALGRGARRRWEGSTLFCCDGNLGGVRRGLPRWRVALGSALSLALPRGVTSPRGAHPFSGDAATVRRCAAFGEDGLDSCSASAKQHTSVTPSQYGSAYVPRATCAEQAGRLGMGDDPSARHRRRPLVDVVLSDAGFGRVSAAAPTSGRPSPPACRRGQQGADDRCSTRP